MQEQKTIFTYAEYLAMETVSEFRHEFYDGEIYGMSGGSPRHSRVKVNITTALDNALVTRPCKVYDSDMLIRIDAANTNLYPDASVVCGEEVFSETKPIALTNPILLVEVISPSSAHRDRHDKFALYRELPSLRDYLSVHQDEALVEYSHSPEPNLWITRVYRGLAATIELHGVGMQLAMVDVYRKIDLDTPEQSR